ncbi:MAG: pyridoxal 5'-phosphate synthase glutaminase subunit PdxT [Candidatus Solibacter usitatus]|nr:pyridoxal 5'-phosphate synthase glutaminase subunit PdxT [Candidatus Solibacter usitatus]
MKKVGVLALQGDFEAHARALERAGAQPVEARTAADLDDLDGLVIPGGESTTMLKLLNRENMIEPLAQFGSRRPIFGTCAGAILMASEVTSPAQQSLHLMDIAVERNAYGRQIDSRVAHISPESEFETRTHPGELEAIFIRAPIIQRVGPGVRVLATYQGDPVLVEQGQHLVATFHPELTQDARVHELFLAKL